MKKKLESKSEGMGFELNENEITVGKMIGAGAFSEVFQGDWSGTDVVIKRYSRSNENAVKNF